jgi:hypothetical protein
LKSFSFSKFSKLLLLKQLNLGEFLTEKQNVADNKKQVCEYLGQGRQDSFVQPRRKKLFSIN